MGSMLPQAQAWASYNPLLGGHSRSIPQGMVQGGGVSWGTISWETFVSKEGGEIFPGTDPAHRRASTKADHARAPVRNWAL